MFTIRDLKYKFEKIIFLRCTMIGTYTEGTQIQDTLARPRCITIFTGKAPGDIREKIVFL